jgi:TolA-binding protein
LPLWSKGSIAVGVTLALVAAFATRTLAHHGDWSDGLLAVTLAALLLAVITLLVGVARAIAGRRSSSTALQTGLLLWLLLSVALVSFAAAPSFHGIQARNALLRGQYAEAYDEFTLGGERAPNAPGIAQSLVGWGESELAQQRYASAADKLAAVRHYASADSSLASQARHDLYTAYRQWMRGDAKAVTYGGDGGALATFQAYQSTPDCDAECKAQMPALLAQSHFQYGQQLMASQQFAQAVTEFETVANQYGTSSYAGQAHTNAAQAYLQLGRQQIAARACNGAVGTYKTLVAHYANTPEAAQAQAALAAPQPVSGAFTGLPTNPVPMVALSAHVNISGFVFSDDYTATPDASGAFTFPGVAQGNYNLSTKRDANNSVSYTYYHESGGNLYTVHVGSLCPVQLGAIAFQS